MNKFLFELGTEEIPAAMIQPATTELFKGFQELLEKYSVCPSLIHCYNSPRRLAFLAEDLPERAPDQSETIIGPPEKIAYGSNQNLTKAGRGFARKYGIKIDRLEIIETGKGRYLGHRQINPGVLTKEIIAAGMGDVITAISWPKNMYWRESRFRFVRPIRWIIALWNEEIVAFEFEGIKTDRQTSGHRFLGAQSISIPHAKCYVDVLHENSVFVDIEERRSLIIRELADLTPKSCTLVEDLDLIELTCFLNERPSAILGRFKKSFLELPKEILVTVMRHHQKYFSVIDKSGKLKSFFLAIINNGKDPDGLIRKGHERVLQARLDDAVFFWNSDCKKTLQERVEDLASVTFQKNLGTYLSKTKRIQSICSLLSSKNDLLQQAALLCKTDLTTESVFEISELQGIIGGLCAREEGYPQEVWQAIYEHYQPVSIKDPLPKTKNGALLSIADRLDTITACFSIGIRPKGSSDPFAIRRQAQGLIRILLDYGFDWTIDDLLRFSLGVLGSGQEFKEEIKKFLGRRLHTILTRQGLENDVIKAVLEPGLGSVSGICQKAKALQEIRLEPEFEALTITYKRIKNILDDQEIDELRVGEVHLVERAEKDLFQEFLVLDHDIAQQLDSGNYLKALNLMASLRGKVDHFFEEVMVLTENCELRRNRLRLLSSISRMFLQVADISMIRQIKVGD